jgi:PAS domain-containing protein
MKEQAIKKKIKKEADAIKLPKTTKRSANKSKNGDASEIISFNEAVLEALPIGVCLTDETGHYYFMNSVYCAIYEYVREEMIGQH